MVKNDSFSIYCQTANDIMVYAVFIIRIVKKIPIKWRVIKRKNQYKVIDIEAFGVWLAQSQRDQFVSVIQNKNHSVQAAINIFKRKNRRD